MMQPATNLMSLDRAALESLFREMGEQRFRARQVMQWIYQRRVLSFDAMTDLSQALRTRLARDAGIALPQIAAQRVSADGTIAWLLRLRDGNCIETVFIPEAQRGTLCVSSQVGCGLNCDFCATARQGFSRNLAVDEIIGQVWVANRALLEMNSSSPPSSSSLQTQTQTQTQAQTNAERPISNVVMMGMGEPLLNFDAVVPAMRLMMDDCSFGLSRRRVTLSTAGLVPAIDRLGETCPVSLAVSLHAPDDALRDSLVPLNRKYPIAALLDACRRYAARGQRQRITFEYVMLRGVNDSVAQARALARRLGDLPAKVNLIPFNPYAGIQYQRSTPDAIDRFREVLIARDIFTVTRKTRGDDIDAACGQLAGKVIDRTSRSRRLAAAAMQSAQ
ncbi:MAG: 23S rRNA (adenine(2503)-C(2))-methyltransferase RlmN [bacterium]